MTTAAAKNLYLFTRDLLSQPEGTVMVLGRDNVSRDDFKALQIVVDSLGNAERTSGGEKFDGVAESMNYRQHWRHQCTVNFYGDGAYEQAERFSLLLQSQLGYELQRDMGISVYEVLGVTDLKLTTGSQYSERYELVLNVGYTTSINITTLRIDEAQFEVIDN